MKKLLMTTVLVSAFAAAPVFAQTTDPAAPADGVTMPDIAVPEGFSRQDVVLTAEDLLGATIYDANGNSIGDVHDLVIDASGAAGAAPGGTGMDTTTGTGLSPDSSGGATGTMPDANGGAAATSDGMATDGTAADGTAADGTVTDGIAPEGTTGAAPSPDAGSGSTGTGMPADDPAAGSDVTSDAPGTTGTVPDAGAATDGMADNGTATDGSSPDAGTATDGMAADDTATDGMASDGTMTGGSATDGTTDGMAADGTAAPGTAGTGAASPATGQITHAVLDIGGFLGMGEHRVAVPISDLAIYRSDSETRVYLPWTQEQLEALPEYDEDDAGTLGRSTMPMAD